MKKQDVILNAPKKHDVILSAPVSGAKDLCISFAPQSEPRSA
jgi:hypothetical protein